MRRDHDKRDRGRHVPRRRAGPPANAQPRAGPHASQPPRVGPPAREQARAIQPAGEQQHDDARASKDERATLVERHLDLARRIAERYRDRGEPLDDLVQVASIGLLKAAERFDPARGIGFETFATPIISGELRRHFRDRGWAVHVPRNLKEATLRVERALAHHGDRAPTPAQLAAETGLDLEEVLEALQATDAHRALSLDAPDGALGDLDLAFTTTGTFDAAASAADAMLHALAPAGDEDEKPDDGSDDDAMQSLVERLSGEDDEIDRARDRATVAQLVRELDAREREILRLRFVEDLTQSEIGARVGISQMHVSRLIRAALNRMRLAARSPSL